MLRILLILFVNFLYANSSVAQQEPEIGMENALRLVHRQIDSLPGLIREGRARMYNSFCRVKDHFDYVLAPGTRMISARALHLDEEEKAAFARMYVWQDFAVQAYNLQEYKTATRYWEEALAIAVKNKFSYEELHIYRRSLNNIYFLAGDYTNAMQISTEGLAAAEKYKDTAAAAHFENVIGYIHMKQNNFVQADRYFTAYLFHSRATGDTVTEAHALFNLADLAVVRQQYDSALFLLNQSLQVYRSIRVRLLFSLPEREAAVNNKLAEVWKRRGDFRKALSFSLSAAAICRDPAVAINLYDKAGYFIQTGEIYNLLAKPDSAVYFLYAGLHIAEEIRHRENLRDGYRQLAHSFAAKKMYDSAYAYLTAFAQLKDSIDHDSNQRDILQRESDLALARQEAEQQVALERQKSARNSILIAAMALLLTLFFLFNRNRLRQKNQYQHELNRQQNELFNAVASAQEQERKRIAQDIHDGLGSVLSAAKLKMAEVKDAAGGMANDPQFITGISLIDEAAAELRNISHNIMPATLSRLGLIPALKSLCENISSAKGTRITFISSGINRRLSEPVELSLYRIVLELVNNVVKHAASEKSSVQLIGYDGYINLVVEDNGKGFQLSGKTGDTTGIGLGNVAARVEYLKGKMDIDTGPGKGTTVIIDIPVTAG